MLKYLEKKDSLNRCLEGNQDSYEEFWRTIEEIKERAIVYINNEDLKSDTEGPVITPPDFQGKFRMSRNSAAAKVYLCVTSYLTGMRHSFFFPSFAALQSNT